MINLNANMSAYELVWKFLKPHKWALFIFLCVAVIWSAELSISPYLLKLIIDGVNKSANHPEQLIPAIGIPAIIYVAISLLLNFTFRIYGITYLQVFSTIRKNAISSVYYYLTHHSYRYFQEHFSGALASKLKDITEGMETMISIPNEVFIPRVLAAIIASSMLTLVNPILSIVLCIWVIVFTYITYQFAKKTEAIALPYSEESTQFDGQVNDSLGNIITTKLFANESFEYARMQAKLDSVINKNKNVLWFMQYAHFTQAFLVTILVSIMMWVLIRERQQAMITIGDFAFVLTLLRSISMQIWDIGQQILRFSKEVSRVQQALNIILLPHELNQSGPSEPLKITHGEIKFSDVKFTYRQGLGLFNGLNIIIYAGQKVGLVGPSGGGKSSFIKLILRLFDLESGKITIDDQCIAEHTKESIRRQIAVIPQDADMFHRSILDNIRFAKPDATFAEVKAAAQKAHCDDFIEQLEQGYDTLVGERGVKLSGGQKQRIAIARAILKNAQILILDEATSALDSVTENYIQESLHDMMLNKTTIVIAHRLSTLKEMDRILYFKDGEIIEDGSLDELIKKDGHFAHLWHMQSQGYLP